MINRLSEDQNLYNKFFEKLLNLAEEADSAYEENKNDYLAMKLRTIVEELCNLTLYCYELDLNKLSIETKLQYVQSTNIFTNDDINLFHNIRKIGNSAAHGEDVSLYNVKAIYEKLVSNFEQYTYKITEFNKQEIKPTIQIARNQRDENNFILYSKRITNFYKLLGALVVFLMFYLGFGCIMAVEGVFDSISNLPTAIIALILLPLLIRFIWKRKMYSPKQLYETFQKFHKNEISDVPILGVVDYSINWDDLYGNKK